MPSLKLPHFPIGKDTSEDLATAAILAAGGGDGVPALAVRYWSPHGGSETPVFITWLLGAGRFCLTVKYGRYSLKGEDWHVSTWRGLRSAPSPLDQARVEALWVSRTLQLGLGRGVPVSPALALPDMERHRCIERLARRSGVPLLWDLERYTAVLAGAETEAHLRQPMERLMVMEEISALMADSAHAGLMSSRADVRRIQSTTGS